MAAAARRKRLKLRYGSAGRQYADLQAGQSDEASEAEENAE